MPGRYVSPIPAAVEMQYRERANGNGFTQRMHLFPQPDGSTMRCWPRYCRECWREQHWHDHGPAGAQATAQEAA